MVWVQEEFVTVPSLSCLCSCDSGSFSYTFWWACEYPVRDAADKADLDEKTAIILLRCVQLEDPEV